MARMSTTKLWYSYKNNPDSKGTPVNLPAKKWKRRLSGRTLSDIDQEIWDYIIVIINDAENFSIAERNAEVINISNWYSRETEGRTLRPEMLEALADFILFNGKKSPDKVSKVAYPILTKANLYLRKKREMDMEKDGIDYFVVKKRYNIAMKKKTKEGSENK